MAVITGGGGNDTLTGGNGADTLDGGGGWNVVAYWGAGGAVGVQLGRGLTSNDGSNAEDRLINIHGVFGSAFGDVLLGSDWGDLLAGLGGADTIEGWGGDDAINGYSGNDRLSGGAGTDTAHFGGARADYTVTAINGGFTITHNTTFMDWGTAVNEGTDTVTEVEFFRFADGLRSAATVTNPNAEPVTPGNSGGGNPAPAMPVVQGTAGGDRIAFVGGQRVYDGAGGRDVLDMGAVGFRPAEAAARPDGSMGVSHGADVAVLRNIEEVRFADGRLVFDAADPAAQVTRLYEAALDRLPDQGGLNYWIDAVQDGQPLSALAGGFLASPEFTARFGGAGTANGAFVDQLYQNVLGRSGEQGGRDFWTGTLNTGASRADVLAGFSESAENKAGTAALVQNGIWDRSETAAEVARLYDTVLGRAPDGHGLSAWTAAIEGGGMTLAQVADAFARSAEFQAVYGQLDSRGFVGALYRNTLGREPDAGGLDGWVDAMGRGMARSDVVLGFSESAEHVALTAPAIGGEQPGQYGILFA